MNIKIFYVTWIITVKNFFWILNFVCTWMISQIYCNLLCFEFITPPNQILCFIPDTFQKQNRKFNVVYVNLHQKQTSDAHRNSFNSFQLSLITFHCRLRRRSQASKNIDFHVAESKSILKKKTTNEYRVLWKRTRRSVVTIRRIFIDFCHISECRSWNCNMCNQKSFSRIFKWRLLVKAVKL